MTSSSDEPRFQQVWPPAGSPGLVACVLPDDTRGGWLRVTWLPDGRVAVQGVREHMRDVPLDLSWPSVTSWARTVGFDSITEQNPPA